MHGFVTIFACKTTQAYNLLRRAKLTPKDIFLILKSSLAYTIYPALRFRSYGATKMASLRDYCR